MYLNLNYEITSRNLKRGMIFIISDSYQIQIKKVRRKNKKKDVERNYKEISVELLK